MGEAKIGEGEEVVVVGVIVIGDVVAASVDILGGRGRSTSVLCAAMQWCNNVAELSSVPVGDSRQTQALRVRYAERTGMLYSHRSQGVRMSFNVRGYVVARWFCVYEWWYSSKSVGWRSGSLYCRWSCMRGWRRKR